MWRKNDRQKDKCGVIVIGHLLNALLAFSFCNNAFFWMRYSAHVGEVASRLTVCVRVVSTGVRSLVHKIYLPSHYPHRLLKYWSGEIQHLFLRRQVGNYSCGLNCAWQQPKVTRTHDWYRDTFEIATTSAENGEAVRRCSLPQLSEQWVEGARCIFVSPRLGYCQWKSKRLFVWFRSRWTAWPPSSESIIEDNNVNYMMH